MQLKTHKLLELREGPKTLTPINLHMIFPIEIAMSRPQLSSSHNRRHNYENSMLCRVPIPLALPKQNSLEAAIASSEIACS